MKILVTGGAGFIGSNFIRYILGTGPHYTIVNYDKLTYAGNLANLEQVTENRNYTFVKGDICDAPFWKARCAVATLLFILRLSLMSTAASMSHRP